MDSALQTLFHPFETDLCKTPAGAERTLFLGASYHPNLENFARDTLALQQYLRPQAAALEERGFHVTPVTEFADNAYGMVLLLAPKNAAETKFMMAQGLPALKDGGLFVCAAANNAGGTRLEKILREAGAEGSESLSKHKARAVWFYKSAGLRLNVLRQWAAEGGIQKICGGRFVSMPGLFGWNKIDPGSEILARCLPEDLTGSGADFGCGYGYLSDFMLHNCQKIKSLCCIDSDARALRIAAKNLENCPGNATVIYRWDDLTLPLRAAPAFDWIVMNPPFHAAEKTDAGVGKSFIRTAAQALKKSGKLYMVANAHLPYEAVLQKHFQGQEKLHEGQGFKIFSAVI